MESIALTVPAAMIMGLGFGAGPCNISCMPYLGPVFLARAGGARRSWRTVAPFSAGRLTGYATLGGVAGLLGHTLQGWFQSPAVQWALGIATILVGLSLLRRRDASACPQPRAQGAQPLRFVAGGGAAPRTGTALTGGLFLMGAGMALSPCAPLGTVLLAASATGSALGGLSLGAGFGVGAIFVPALVFGLLVAHLGGEMREHLARWRRVLERAAAVMLITLGLATAAGWMQP